MKIQLCSQFQSWEWKSLNQNKRRHFVVHAVNVYKENWDSLFKSVWQKSEYSIVFSVWELNTQTEFWVKYIYRMRDSQLIDVNTIMHCIWIRVYIISEQTLRIQLTVLIKTFSHKHSSQWCLNEKRKKIKRKKVQNRWREFI